MKRLNLNFLALVILLIAYVFSAGRFYLITRDQGDGEEGSKRRVIITHWQLEPGYRDAMQWAIDRYNQLPHVKEANVEVEQLAISTRVYNQFMNVHLISGTAPDIAGKGFTQLIQGNNTAKFYAALGEFVNDPNPYHAPEYLSEDLPEDLRDFLANASWRDTFTDGMLSGFDNLLDDYYAVPISSWGSIRLFYNARLLEQGKAFILEAISQQNQPAWLQRCWLREHNGHVVGYLPDDAQLRAWLENDSPPETLGQLILYCKAIQAYAAARQLPYLVPISGGPGVADITDLLRPLFLSHFYQDLEKQIGGGVTPFRGTVGFGEGVWDFESPEVRGYFEVSRLISSFFPPGFLGLDRDQAQRRFILGNAAIIATGGWDASGIFLGASDRDNPEDAFEVLVEPMPIPVKGERWAEFVSYRTTEAHLTTGVPMAVNKSSKNFNWALDFLRFLSSQPINQEFNQRAEWLPVTVGAEPVEQMARFTPLIEGMPPNRALNPARSIAPVRNQWVGLSMLYVTGDITYEEFSRRMTEHLNNPRLGVENYWFRHHQTNQDSSRARDRSIAVERFKALAFDDESAAERERSLFYTSLLTDEGVQIELIWDKSNPGEPLPTF